MTLAFYKLIHILGLLLVFGQLGLVVATIGQKDSEWRKTLAIMHGLGLFLLLLGGFGMLARLEVISFPWPGWVFGKLVIWLVIGSSATWIRKMPERARLSMGLVIVLGTIAAYLALYKPF